jgi:hypothetical protein
MEFEAPEPPEHRKTGHHTLDMVTSVCALAVSFISIFMAWQNGHDMEKLVHANSWPALQLSSGNSGEAGGPEIGFALENAGIGPARLHTFDFLVDGAAINEPYWLGGILKACCAEALQAALARAGGDLRRAVGKDGNRPIASSFLSPHETARAIRWPRSDDNEELWRALDVARQARRIVMRVCYCSVFDECWIAQNGVFPPRPVAACPAR